MAAEARALGRGGVSIAARASALSRPAVYRTLAGLDVPPAEPERVRRGGGRRRAAVKDPQLLADLERHYVP
jgi:hypothetical protein